MKKNIQFKTLELPNGETLGYRECGYGSINLLLIHGNLGSSLSFDTLMERIPDDFKAYAVDLRGFGASTYNKPAEAIRDLSQDIKLFVDALEINNLILAGWSAGGAVAMQFSVDYPDYVEKLILINSCSIKGYPVFKRNILGRPIQGQYAKTKQDMTTLLGTLKKAFDEKKMDTINKIFDMELFKIKKPEEERYKAYREEVTKQRNVVDFNYSLINFNISRENNGVVPGTGEVDKIEVPVLILQGDKDTLVNMTMAEEIKKGIGENAELITIKESGHVPFIDNLDELLYNMVNFVRW